jgi:hypothetical protein
MAVPTPERTWEGGEVSTAIKLIGLAWLLGGLFERDFHIPWLPFVGFILIVVGMIFEPQRERHP